MSNPRINIVFAGPFEVLHGYPREVACHVTTHARSLSLLLQGEGPLETVLKTGG